MLRSVTMNMSQLKPIIIVLLMLTSALAGCTGTDTTDLEQQIEDLQQSNDEMNETINQQRQDLIDHIKFIISSDNIHLFNDKKYKFITEIIGRSAPSYEYLA